ncbi:MAG: helix-turn-helix domain-containing protein, partial [Candidatus Acidiferrales bacterium]
TLLIDVDVRILVATNKNLQEAVAQKSFREDLYFRVSSVPVTIPPLRERGDDVILLAGHFLERFRREFRKPQLELTDAARARLRGYHWPGNVRELQNTIERASILADGDAIGPDELQLPLPRPGPTEMPAGMLNQEFPWDGSLEDVSQRAVHHVERFKIETALREEKWNKSRAAEKLGVSYKTLLHKIRALGLEN